MLLAFLTWIVKCSCWHVFFPLCLISELSEKEGKQLSAVADASTAAARAGCHPAALTQHTRPQRRRYGRQLRVLGPQGGARGEGQCPAETLLCSYGYCWSQVGSGECGISSNVSHSLQSLREAKWCEHWTDVGNGFLLQTYRWGGRAAPSVDDQPTPGHARWRSLCLPVLL